LFVLYYYKIPLSNFLLLTKSRFFLAYNFTKHPNIIPTHFHKNEIKGDCIHTVKPYFGLGANSALEDVKIFEQSLDFAQVKSFFNDNNDNNVDSDKHSSFTTTTSRDMTNPRRTSTNNKIPQAIQHFTKQHANDSKTLVRISRELDRPGKLGFITFILPIILDSIFSTKFPNLFSPNTITMLQNENLKFTQVAAIKRHDRLLQASIILGSISITVKVLMVFVQTVAKVLGTSSSRIWIGSVIAGSLVSLASKLYKQLMQQRDTKPNQLKS
jgi:hypothetical protein